MELPPPAHDPGAVRDLADSILADPRYDFPEPSLPERILDWFVEQIGKVLGSFAGSGAGTFVAWALVAAAVGVVVYLVARYGRIGALPSAPERRPSTMVELTRSPAEWRADAARLEAEGRWREGLRCRHRALIAELVRRGVVPDQAGRTAREHARDVAASLPAVAPEMAAATELFEAVWYGGLPSGPDEAARFVRLDRQILGTRVDAR